MNQWRVYPSIDVNLAKMKRAGKHLFARLFAPLLCHDKSGNAFITVFIFVKVILFENKYFCH